MKRRLPGLNSPSPKLTNGGGKGSVSEEGFQQGAGGRVGDKDVDSH